MARGGRTRRTLVAVAVTGVVVTLAILAWLTGAVRRGDGRPIVEGVAPQARDAQLKQAEEGTRERRDAARRELEQLPPPR
jgi:hypothetical protein